MKETVASQKFSTTAYAPGSRGCAEISLVLLMMLIPYFFYIVKANLRSEIYYHSCCSPHNDRILDRPRTYGFFRLTIVRQLVAYCRHSLTDALWLVRKADPVDGTRLACFVPLSPRRAKPVWSYLRCMAMCRLVNPKAQVRKQ